MVTSPIFAVFTADIFELVCVWVAIGWWLRVRDSTVQQRSVGKFWSHLRPYLYSGTHGPQVAWIPVEIRSRTAPDVTYVTLTLSICANHGTDTGGGALLLPLPGRRVLLLYIADSELSALCRLRRVFDALPIGIWMHKYVSASGAASVSLVYRGHRLGMAVGSGSSCRKTFSLSEVL